MLFSFNEEAKHLKYKMLPFWLVTPYKKGVLVMF